MSQFTPLEEPISNPVSATVSKVNRIRGPALGILHDYHAKHPGQVPSLSIREALAAEIQKIPGNEHFKAGNVYTWFKRRASQAQAASQAVTPVPYDSRFPTLTAEALKHLDVMSRGQLNPDTEIIMAWSSLLKASPGDIETWLHCKRLSLNQVTHPPTPASTVTPEPSVPPTPVSPIHPFQHYREHDVHRSATPASGLKQDSKSPVIPPMSVNTGTQNKVYATQRPHHQQQQPSPVSPSFMTSASERRSVLPPQRHNSYSAAGNQGIHSPQRSYTYDGVNTPNGPPQSASMSRQNTSPYHDNRQSTQSQPSRQSTGSTSSASASVARQSTPIPHAPSPPSSPGPPPGMSHVRYAIYKGIEKVRNMPPSAPDSERVPQSPAELSAMFEPYEKKIAFILEAIEKEKERERLERAKDRMA